MILYTCGTKTVGPGLLHPCAKAGGALDEAGHSYEIKTVPGYKLLFWTRSGDERAEIAKLSGQSDVPPGGSPGHVTAVSEPAPRRRHASPPPAAAAGASD